MKRAIFSEFRSYNANSRGKFTGDCAKRALSLAFSMDYNDVSSELNRIKRDNHYSVFNDVRVINKFLQRRNVYMKRSTDMMTVSDFSDIHSHGTYVIFTGGDKLASQGGSNHMLCIIDGDVYDSWYSMDQIVVQYGVVTSEDTGVIDVTIADIADPVAEFVVEYVQKLQFKFDFGIIYADTPEDNGYINKYTGQFDLAIELDDVPEAAPIKYRLGNIYRTQIIVKVNPRLSIDKNIEMSKKKCKQRIYDFFYNINKDLSDARAAETLEHNPKFPHFSRVDLMKLPDWSRSLVTDFYINDDGSSFSKYEVYMEPLDGDPRGDRQVYFRSDTLRDLKHDMELYKDSYARIDYDY